MSYRLSPTQIVGLIVMIFGILVAINIPIFTYKITLPDGILEAKIGLRDIILDYLRQGIIVNFKLQSVSIDREAYKIMKDLEEKTNEYIENITIFRDLYYKLLERYSNIQVCYNKARNVYLCANYILYPKRVILSVYLSSDAPTILFSKEYFNKFYMSYINKQFKESLSTIVEGYKEGKVIFVNFHVSDFLSALS